jgi:DNA polymerase elongation subunit (family B)
MEAPDLKCIGAECQFKVNLSKEHLLHHIKCQIPTKILYAQRNLVPSRTDLLDAKTRTVFSAQVRGQKPIIFMPNAVLEKNDFVDGALKYRIYITGTLPCGSKTCVILDNVEVHVDIMVPDGMGAKEYDDIIRGQMVTKNLTFAKIANVHKFKLHGFQKAKRVYKRIYFNTLQERKKVIEFVTTMNKTLQEAGKPLIETASDDTGRDNYYFPKVAREFRFATADWNRIETYDVLDSAKHTTNCSYTLLVDVKNYKKLSKAKRNELSKPTSFVSKTIDRDLTMTAQWDIETHRKIQNGQVPTPQDNDYTIFMLCTGYFWHWSDEPLMGVCCVDIATKARPGVGLVIECGNEQNTLQAHFEVMGKMAPDILAAFNGGNFDWPLTREKLRRYKMLVWLKSQISTLPRIMKGRFADDEEGVLKWNFKSESIKIDAETKHNLTCVANFPGMIDTDVLPVFLKLYPRAEVRKAFSLNFFLKKNGLDAKDDMPYKRMFRIYERAPVIAKAAKVNKTCHCVTRDIVSENALSIDQEGNKIPPTERVIHKDIKVASVDKYSHAVEDECAACQSLVRDIDYKPIEGSTGQDTEYTKILHDDLCAHVDGNVILTDPSDPTSRVQICCCCGKKPRNLTDVADVGYYCYIDCLRPQQLYVKRIIIPEKRELSTLSYVSLYDSFYRADGMKVRNLIGVQSHKYDIAFSNARTVKSRTDKDHYPGAWVFPPIRGLNNKRPIVGLDFASLYPSLMMAYNFSPDMIVYTREEAEKLIAEGYALHHIEPFEYERGEKKGMAGNQHLTKEGWAVRHNGIFNKKHDTKTVQEYVKTIHLSWGSDNGQAAPLKITYIDKDGPSPDQQILIDTAIAAKVEIIRKVTHEPTYGREPLVGERLGIFPFILKNLFDKRVPIKREFVRLSKIEEQMELAGAHEWLVVMNGVEITMSEDDIAFQINKVNSKQKAIKVLSNTFYGESGNYMSSVYELLVAAGVTCEGQKSIKKVSNLVADKGHESQYGDTDSIYITSPDEVYAKPDNEYQNAMNTLAIKYKDVPNEPLPTKPLAIEYKKERVEARIIYWTEMVNITMKVMTELNEEVTDFLIADNGTLRLKMAYEEVGFPTVLSGKKKYFMTPHIETINFYPKNIFIRGIDIIKQGQAGMTKQLGEEFMRETLSPENEREMIDIAHDKIRKFHEMKTTVDLFLLSAKYKPTKRNIPVLTFVARMRERVKKHADDQALIALYEPPEAGDKFTFVIVKKDQRFTLQGTKIELKKGDKMEFKRVYLASQNTPNPMEIDMNYYMKNAIVGLFARFIAYHDKFQPPANTFDIADKLEYRKMDEFCVKEAGKYLETFCDNITGFDKTLLAQQGKDYRKIYKSTDEKVRVDLAQRYGSAGYIMYNVNVHNDDVDDKRAQSTRIVEQFKMIAADMAESEEDYGAKYIKFNNKRETPISMFQLRRIYSSDRGVNVTKVRLECLRRKECVTIEKLFKLLPGAARIIYKYEHRFIELIDDMRKVKTEDAFDLEIADLEQLNALEAAQSDTIKGVHVELVNLIVIYKMRVQLRSLVGVIELEKAKIINEPIDPKVNVKFEAKHDALVADELPDYEWN